MIRFIDLGDQILEGTRQFAWFDTIVDRFDSFCDNQAWETWLEFETDFRHNDKEVAIANLGNLRPLERYKSLFPKKWPAS